MVDFVPFTCLYKAALIPEGARKVHEQYFRADDLLIRINRAVPSEIRIAISMKERDLLWDELLLERPALNHRRSIDARKRMFVSLEQTNLVE